jgi:hypothetical protein
MDIELKELGQTLAVGAFAMLGFWLILKTFITIDLKDLKPNVVSFDNLFFGGILLAFVFAVGIVLENISKHVVADRDPPSVTIRSAFTKNLQNDKIGRFDVLFDKHGDREWYSYIPFFPDNRKLEKSRLYKRLLDENYVDYLPYFLRNQFRDPVLLYPATIIYPSTNRENQDCLNFASDLFYNAKDRVYQEENAFKELTTISTRMDFLRAFVFLSELLIYLFIISFIYNSVKLWKPKDKIKKQNPQKIQDASREKT